MKQQNSFVFGPHKNGLIQPVTAKSEWLYQLQPATNKWVGKENNIKQTNKPKKNKKNNNNKQTNKQKWVRKEENTKQTNKQKTDIWVGKTEKGENKEHHMAEEQSP